MHIDWQIASSIIAPIIALFIGAALDRFIERKAKLIAYFAHTSAFNVVGANSINIHTHGIVIKNIGARTATDIRVRHIFLPNFTIFPIIEHRVEQLPGGGVEIIFPTLVPNEQVTISYLYFPPVLWNQIHAGIRHSEGFATEVTILPTPQYPAWLRRTLLFLLILGIVAFIYLAIKFFSIALCILSNFQNCYIK